MSTQDVTPLDRYRGRRTRRLAQARALYGGDPLRARLVELLQSLASRVGADRAAVVWVDDYGTPAVHAYCLLDLTSGAERRTFDVELLHEAWDQGVPGLIDRPNLGPGTARVRAPRSSAVVALGSDGTRSWFAVVDSLTPRERLSTMGQQDAFMYVSGLMGSVVLHREIGGDVSGLESARAGWSVLQDMAESDESAPVTGRIGTRFFVARLVRAAIEEDFAFEIGGLGEQIAHIERQLSSVEAGDAERDSWERILDAVRRSDRAELATAVLELGQRVLTQGHLEGAGHFFESAYLLGVGAALAGAAIDGARYQAVVARRQGRWDDMLQWYGIARELATAYGDQKRLAYVLDGLGISCRHRGDFEQAVEYHRRVIELGAEIGHREVQAFGHQQLAADLRARGRLLEAVRHGWKGFELHARAIERFRALTTLAGLLRALGDLDSAGHAYSIVARHADVEMKLLALDALAYLEALRGDEAAFRENLERVDETEWRSAEPHIVASLIYYRGRGFALLGVTNEAEMWLKHAIEFAEERGRGRIAEEARQTLRELHAGEVTPREGMAISRDGSGPELGAIRKALVAMSESPPVWAGTG